MYKQLFSCVVHVTSVMYAEIANVTAISFSVLSQKQLYFNQLLFSTSIFEFCYLSPMQHHAVQFDNNDLQS